MGVARSSNAVAPSLSGVVLDTPVNATNIPVVDVNISTQQGMVTSTAQPYHSPTSPPAAVTLTPLQLLTNTFGDRLGGMVSKLRAYWSDGSVEVGTQAELATQGNDLTQSIDPTVEDNTPASSASDLPPSATEADERESTALSLLNSLACAGIAASNPMVKVVSAALCFAGEVETTRVKLPVALTKFSRFLRYVKKPNCDPTWALSQYLTLTEASKKQLVEGVLKKRPDLVQAYFSTDHFLQQNKAVQNALLLSLNQMIDEDFKENQLPFTYFKHKYELDEAYTATNFFNNMLMLKDAESVALAKNYLVEDKAFMHDFKQDLLSIDGTQALVFLEVLPLFQKNASPVTFFTQRTPAEINSILSLFFHNPELADNEIYKDIILTHPSIVNRYFSSTVFATLPQKIKDQHISTVNTLYFRNSFNSIVSRFNRDFNDHKEAAVVCLVESLLHTLAPTEREQAALHLMHYSDVLTLYKDSSEFKSASKEAQQTKLIEIENLMSEADFTDIASAGEVKELRPKFIDRVLTLFSDAATKSVSKSLLSIENDQLQLNADYVKLTQAATFLHQHLEAVKNYLGSEYFKSLDTPTQARRKNTITKLVKELNRELFKKGMIGIPLASFFEDNDYIRQLPTPLAENQQRLAEIEELEQQLETLKSNDASNNKAISDLEQKIKLKREIASRAMYALFARAPSLQAFLPHLASEGKAITLSETQMLKSFIEEAAKNPTLFREASFDDATIDEAVELYGLMTLLQPLLLHKYQLREQSALGDYVVALDEYDYDAVGISAMVQREVQKTGVETCGVEEFIPFPPTDIFWNVYGAIVRYQRAGGFDKIMDLAFRYNFMQESKARMEQTPSAKMDYFIYVLKTSQSKLSTSTKAFMLASGLSTLKEEGPARMMLQETFYQDLLYQRQISSLTAEQIHQFLLVESIYANLMGLQPFAGTLNEVIASIDTFSDEQATTKDKGCAAGRTLAAIASDAAEFIGFKKVTARVGNFAKSKFLAKNTTKGSKKALAETSTAHFNAIKKDFVDAGFTQSHINHMYNQLKDYTVVDNDKILRAILAETCDIDIEKRVALSQLSTSEYNLAIADLRFYYPQLFAKKWQTITDQASMLRTQLLNTSIYPNLKTLHNLAHFLKKIDEEGLSGQEGKVFLAELLNMGHADKLQFTGLSLAEFSDQLSTIAQKHAIFFEQSMSQKDSTSFARASAFQGFLAQGFQEKEIVSALGRFYHMEDPQSLFNSPLQPLHIANFFGDLSQETLQKLQSLGSHSAINSFMHEIANHFGDFLYSSHQFEPFLKQKNSALLHLNGKYAFLHYEAYAGHTLYLPNSLDHSALDVTKQSINTHVSAIRIDENNKSALAKWLGNQGGIRCVNANLLRQLSTDTLQATTYDKLSSLTATMQGEVLTIRAKGDKYVTYGADGMLDGNALSDMLSAAHQDSLHKMNFVNFKSPFGAYGGSASTAQVLANTLRASVIAYEGELTGAPVVVHPAPFGSNLIDLSEKINSKLSMDARKAIAKLRPEFRHYINSQALQKATPFGNKADLVFMQREMATQRGQIKKTLEQLNELKEALEEAKAAGRASEQDIVALNQAIEEKKQAIVTAKERHQALQTNNESLTKAIVDAEAKALEEAKTNKEKSIAHHIRCKRAGDDCAPQVESLVSLDRPPVSDTFWQEFDGAPLTEKQFRQKFIDLLTESNLEAVLTELDEAAQIAQDSLERAKLVNKKLFYLMMIYRAKSFVYSASKLVNIDAEAGMMQDPKKAAAKKTHKDFFQARMFKELGEAFRDDYQYYLKHRADDTWLSLYNDEFAKHLSKMRSSYSKLKIRVANIDVDLTPLEENKKEANRIFNEVLGRDYAPLENGSQTRPSLARQNELYKLIVNTVSQATYAEITDLSLVQQITETYANPARYYHMRVLVAANRCSEGWYDLKAKIADYKAKEQKHLEVQGGQTGTNMYEAKQAVNRAWKYLASKILIFKQIESIISTNQENQFFPFPDTLTYTQMSKWASSGQRYMASSIKLLNAAKEKYNKAVENLAAPENTINQILQEFLDMFGQNSLITLLTDPVFNQIDVDIVWEPDQQLPAAAANPQQAAVPARVQQSQSRADPVLPPQTEVRVSSTLAKVSSARGLEIFAKAFTVMDQSNEFLVNANTLRETRGTYPLRYYLAKLAGAERRFKRGIFEVKEFIIKLMNAEIGDAVELVDDLYLYRLSEKIEYISSHTMEYLNTLEVFINGKENIQVSGLSPLETRQFASTIKLASLDRLLTETRDSYVASRQANINQFTDKQVTDRVIEYLSSRPSIKTFLNLLSKHEHFLHNLHKALERESDRANEDVHSQVDAKFSNMIHRSIELYTGASKEADFASSIALAARQPSITVHIPANLQATNAHADIPFPLNSEGRVLFSRIMEKIHDTEQMLVNDALIEEAKGEYPAKYYLAKLGQSERFIQKLVTELKSFMAMQLHFINEQDKGAEILEVQNSITTTLDKLVFQVREFSNYLDIFSENRQNLRPKGFYTGLLVDSTSKIDLTKLDAQIQKAQLEYNLLLTAYRLADQDVNALLQAQFSLGDGVEVFSALAKFEKYLQDYNQNNAQQADIQAPSGAAANQPSIISSHSNILQLSATLRLNDRGIQVLNRVFEYMKGLGEDLLVNAKVMAEFEGNYPVRYYLAELGLAERRLKGEWFHLKLAIAEKLKLLKLIQEGNREINSLWMLAQKTVAEKMQEVTRAVVDYRRVRDIFQNHQHLTMPAGKDIVSMAAEVNHINFDAFDASLHSFETDYNQRIIALGYTDQFIQSKLDEYATSTPGAKIILNLLAEDNLGFTLYTAAPDQAAPHPVHQSPADVTALIEQIAGATEDDLVQEIMEEVRKTSQSINNDPLDISDILHRHSDAAGHSQNDPLEGSSTGIRRNSNRVQHPQNPQAGKRPNDGSLNQGGAVKQQRSDSANQGSSGQQVNTEVRSAATDLTRETLDDDMQGLLEMLGGNIDPELAQLDIDTDFIQDIFDGDDAPPPNADGAAADAKHFPPPRFKRELDNTGKDTQKKYSLNF